MLSSHSLPAAGEQASGSPGSVSKVYAVWPQLLLLSNGALVLASGRPGIGFWVSPDADGARWVGYDVEAEHSAHLRVAAVRTRDLRTSGTAQNADVPCSIPCARRPSDPWDAAHGTGTTSYTGIAEVEPGVVLLAYDKTSGAGRSGAVQKVYSVRIAVR